MPDTADPGESDVYPPPGPSALGQSEHTLIAGDRLHGVVAPFEEMGMPPEP